jgi:hypothetical protein
VADVGVVMVVIVVTTNGTPIIRINQLNHVLMCVTSSTESVVASTGRSDDKIVGDQLSTPQNAW